MFKEGLKLTRSIRAYVMRTISSQEQDVLFETINNAGVITLNRPNALNSLKLNMVEMILSQLQDWEKSKDLVIIKGAGDKAFCAGGDVKLALDQVQGPKFFHTEYNIDYLIDKYEKPYIAFMDGITMGGGLGLSLHGRYRIATEKTTIAMPETNIGLAPDWSHFFARLGDNLGVYLGLTGERLKAKDVVKAGIATHFVPSGSLHELEKLLTCCASDMEICNLLSKFNEPPEEFSLTPYLKHINYCFAASTVEEIIQRLEKVKNDWSFKTLKRLRELCPGSLKISLRLLQRSAQLELEQCLRMEYRIACRIIVNHNFFEGVRARLIDKDNKPQWKPKTLEEVTDDYVESYFKKLPEERELKFFDAKL